MMSKEESDAFWRAGEDEKPMNESFKEWAAPLRYAPTIRECYLAGQSSAEQRVKELEEDQRVDEQRVADLMADLNRVGFEKEALQAKNAELERERDELRQECDTRALNALVRVRELKAQAGEPVDSDDKAAAYMDARLWEFIDMAAVFPKAKQDERTWEHVMVYAPKTRTQIAEHDEDLLEQLYWEFDAERKKSGNERINFKGKLRFYANHTTPSTPAAERPDPCKHEFVADARTPNDGWCALCGEKYAERPDHRKVMEMALDALIYCAKSGVKLANITDAIVALRNALKGEV